MKIKIKILKTITAVALSLSPWVSIAQAPSLGTAADFVIFSSVGAVTNSGTGFLTKLTGHVGANSGAISGFGNVDGNMYAGGPASALCAIDLLSAYNQLNAAIPGFFPAPLLGSGQILVPGTYSINGATVLNSNLILDGLGNPSAVFIIQIQGSFSTNANSKIQLINGTKACNVFWKVEGLVNMGFGTNMKGTIIANNAAINMSVGDTLEGRVLSTNGAITISQIRGYTPIGCGSPVLTGPIQPTLGSVACYGIFSSNGAVTNVGVTTVTGDIGSNGGAAVGYNPLFVNGIIHPIPDISTAAAAVDLLNAYAYLNALPSDILLLYPAQFGNNLILTPHTYLMNGAVTLTDSLFLNAQGNANAVFVIQVNGAFSSSGVTKIVLMNGAQSKNIYWKIDGAVNISSNSIFKGTIICNNAAIILNSGVDLDGRALTTTGALSTLAMTVAIPSSINFFTQPISQTICAGNSVSLTALASGSGLTYQWRKGLVNLINGGNISGATSATLVINPVNISDTSSFYNLVISGQCSSNETSINVSVMLNNVIVNTQPSNQTACSGGTVNFIALATGPSITYQWRKGIVNLINGGNISGVNTATLVFNPVNISDTSSFYNVVIGGLCLPAFTSTNVSLKLNNPNITIQPVNQTACSGASVSFSAVATGSGITYQWRKGSANLINGGNISGATSPTLIINPVGISDVASNYNVIIMGSCAPNFTSNNVSLILNSLNILTQPVNQTQCSGASVSFSAMATGSGLTYQWRKGSANLINGGNISGATSATLIINPVGISDVASNYNVIIAGTCAPNDTSNNVSLILNNPTIISQPNNTNGCVGNPITFVVSVSGTALTYQWRKGNTNLNNVGSISGVNSPTLSINPTTLSDVASNYNVIITGSCLPSDTSSNASLQLNSIPLGMATSNSTACIGGSINLTTSSVSVGTFSWSGPNGFTSPVQNPTIYNAETLNAGTYSLLVTSNGCAAATSTVAVVVNNCNNSEFFIPEGFSPNGDVINDVFFIRGILNYPNNAFVIYNRWGDKVFDASPYQNTWDGKANQGIRIGGDELPVGIYFYVLDLKDGSKVFKGTIYLNR